VVAEAAADRRIRTSLRSSWTERRGPRKRHDRVWFHEPQGHFHVGQWDSQERVVCELHRYRAKTRRRQETAAGSSVDPGRDEGEEEVMTVEERVSAVAEFGFTQRQARFLAMAMRHGGVCLLRQYSAFAGIVHGQKTRVLFHKLVSRRYASAYACRHNRARLYHVHHYPLFRAIGEPNSPYRRPVPAGRIVERLMLLDAVLADPQLNWLVTEGEKVAYFTTSPCHVPVEKLPRATLRVGSPLVGDPFPDKLPIGIDSSGRGIFLYLLLPSGRDDFRAFLGRHADLFRTLPSWTLRLVFPLPMAHAYAGLQAVVRDELESPLHPKTVEELKWYFRQLRATPNARVRPTDERLDRASEAFERPRFYRLYRRWVKDGDSTLDSVSSTLINDALASGAGRVECLVLPHRYAHLSPLVDILGASSPGAESVEKRGERTPAPSRPASVPATDDPGSPSFG
jgi:hypothetical protein